jgi:hypothetical protein
MYALSDSKPPNLPICVNAEAFSRLTDPRRIDFYRVSCILDHHFSSTTNTTTTIPTPPVRWNAGLHHTKVSPSNRNILRCRRLNPTGEHGSPSVFDPFFYHFPSQIPSRSLNGAASVLGLVSVFHYHLFSLRASSSLSSLVFCVINPATAYHLPPPSTVCMQKSLHSPSPLPAVFTITNFHDNPKNPQFRHLDTQTYQPLSQPFAPRPLFLDRLSVSYTLVTETPSSVLYDLFSSELRNPSDCR